MGVQSVLPGRTLWHSEIDPGACKVLAHRWPDVPNLGDITAVDWATVEPIDILTGGFPCQDVSHAGRRAGLIRGEGGTRTGLWAEMLTAIKTLRPRLVVAENVRGLLSARADSDMEPCPWCLGDDDDRPALRALGAVLGDLADIGYDAWWTGLRAADIGAPHGRFRVFIFAWPADLGAAADAGGEHWEQWRLAAPGQAASWRALGQPSGRDRAPVELLPTPKASNNENRSSAWANGPNLGEGALLPTPRATDGTKGGPNQRGSSGDLMLPSAVQLLPTPRVTQAGYADDGRGGKSLDVEARRGDRWGDYAAAIARWERTLGRPAPNPTKPGRTGNPRLNPQLVEWMMGWPAGHVTNVPGITDPQALRICGNGVVPQQAAAATRALLHDLATESAA